MKVLCADISCTLFIFHNTCELHKTTLRLEKFGIGILKTSFILCVFWLTQVELDTSPLIIKLGSVEWNWIVDSHIFRRAFISRNRFEFTMQEKVLPKI